MKNYSFIVLLVFLISCTSENNSKQIQLFNDINLPLLENEHVVEINAENQADYSSTFAEHPFQIPLFKYIEGKNYKMYIGLPFKAKLIDLYKFPLIRYDEMIDSQTDSETFYYKSQKLEEKYIVEYTVNYDGNTVYFLIKTDTAETADSLFNYSALHERMSQNQH